MQSKPQKNSFACKKFEHAWVAFMFTAMCGNHKFPAQKPKEKGSKNTGGKINPT